MIKLHVHVDKQLFILHFPVELLLLNVIDLAQDKEFVDIHVIFNVI